MVRSLAYVSTLMFLALILKGISQFLSVDQVMVTMFVAILAAAMSLVLTLLTTKGKTWVPKVLICMSFFSLTHLYHLEFPSPGLIIFSTNMLLFCASYYLLNRVLRLSL
jgi:hypothetical protein